MEVFCFVGCIETTPFASQPHPALCALRPPFARLLLFRGFYSFFCEIETTSFASQPHPALCVLRPPFARPLLFRGFYSLWEFLVIMESTYRV